MRVVYENFPTRVLVSKSRRAKYFQKGDRLPKKYENNKRYSFNQKTGRLYDVISGEDILKNPLSVGKENYVQIAGNEIYARMHERKRMKIVDTLKEFFKEGLDPLAKDWVDEIPISIKMVVFRPFGYANWDIDNMWIYNKCFIDALRDKGIVKDDNVNFVRAAGHIRFEPIKESDTPTMIFLICQDSHYSYSSLAVEIIEESSGKPGEISVKGDRLYIYTGKKKILYQAAERSIRKALYWCQNNLRTATVSEQLFNKYAEFFKCFEDNNVHLNIY